MDAEKEMRRRTELREAAEASPFVASHRAAVACAADALSWRRPLVLAAALVLFVACVGASHALAGRFRAVTLVALAGVVAVALEYVRRTAPAAADSALAFAASALAPLERAIAPEAPARSVAEALDGYARAMAWSEARAANYRAWRASSPGPSALVLSAAFATAAALFALAGWSAFVVAGVLGCAALLAPGAIYNNAGGRALEAVGPLGKSASDWVSARLKKMS